jgi:hypothetical protein
MDDQVDQEAMREGFAGWLGVLRSLEAVQRSRRDIGGMWWVGAASLERQPPQADYAV